MKHAFDEVIVTLDQLYGLRCKVGRLLGVFPASKLKGPAEIWINNPSNSLFRVKLDQFTPFATGKKKTESPINVY